MLFYRKKLSTANYGSAHCGAWGLIVYSCQNLNRFNAKIQVYLGLFCGRETIYIEKK